jgi:hypothetical protein
MAVQLEYHTIIVEQCRAVVTRRLSFVYIGNGGHTFESNMEDVRFMQATRDFSELFFFSRNAKCYAERTKKRTHKLAKDKTVNNKYEV